VILLGQKGKNLFLGHSNGFVGHHVQKVGDASSSARLLKRSLISSLKIFGHPDQPFEAAVADEPLPLGDIVFAVAHETGVTAPPADRAGQGGELHAAGVIPMKSRLTVITPLHIGRMAAMHSQQPQVVMGS